MADGCAPLYGQANVLDHLSGVDFHTQYALHALREFGNRRRGERPEGDGAQHAHADALLAAHLDGLEGDACGRAKGHNQVVGVLRLVFLVAHLLLPDLLIFALQAQVVLFHSRRLQFEAGDDVLAAPLHTRGCPGAFLDDFFVRAAGLEWGQYHLLHHLSDDAVAQYHHRVAVAEGQRETEVDKVGHLLHTGGSQHDDVVVAVASAARRLEVVALTGLDGAQAWASALYVDDEAGQFGTGHVRDALLHQGDARTAGRRHHSFTCGRTAVDHVDAGHFALCLQHHHARGFPGLFDGQCLQHFALWGDGVTKIAVASAAYGGVCDGLVTLHQ